MSVSSVPAADPAVVPVVDYEPPLEASVAARAWAAGVQPEELMYDLLLEDEGRAFYAVLGSNYVGGSLDACREMLLADHTVTGLSDAGAHVNLISDCSASTFHLTHWARDRSRGERLPVELLVHKLTRANAGLYGLDDRGLVAEGYRADLNVIDLDGLRIHRPVLRHDLGDTLARVLAGVDHDALAARGRGHDIAVGAPGTCGEAGDQHPGSLSTPGYPTSMGQCVRVDASRRRARQVGRGTHVTSHEWGRVADDGTVFVRTADGERSVGQYPVGTPEEALKFFTDRYDALEFEVGLLEQRVGAGVLSPEEATESVKRVRGQVVDANAVGDLDSLTTRLDAIAPVIAHQREARKAERAERKAPGRRKREGAFYTGRAIVQYLVASALDPTWNEVRAEVGASHGLDPESAGPPTATGWSPFPTSRRPMRSLLSARRAPCARRSRSPREARRQSTAKTRGRLTRAARPDGSAQRLRAGDADVVEQLVGHDARQHVLVEPREPLPAAVGEHRPAPAQRARFHRGLERADRPAEP